MTTLAGIVAGVGSRLSEGWVAFTRRGSLRARIFLWAFAPTVVILGIVTVLTSLAPVRATQALVADRNAELTQLKAGQLAAELVQYADLLDRLASSTDVRSGVPARQRVALRWAIGDLLAFDGGVVVLDIHGIVVAADPRRLDTVGADWSTRSLAASASATLRGETPRVGLGSNVESVGPDGRPAVAVSLPVFDVDRRATGLIVGLLEVAPPRVARPNAFQRTLGKVRQARSQAVSYLVDARGRALGLSGAERAGDDLSAQPAVRAALAQGSGALRTRADDGHQVIASYAPVPDTAWTLVGVEDWAALTAPATSIGRLALGLLVLGLALPVAIVSVALGRIMRPVADLTGAARRMAGGELGQVIEVPPAGELRDLATAFNRMSAELRDLYHDLERRVAGRTRELATLNAIASVAGRSLDADQVLDGALDRTLEGLGAGAGLAFTYDRGAGELTLVAQRGASSDAVAPAARPTLRAEHTALTALEPELCALEPLRVGDLGALLAAEGWGWAIPVPLIARDTLLALLVLHGDPSHELSLEERELLRAVGRQVGVAVENARLYAAAEEAAVAAERSRLARELHDSVTQTLFSANLIAGVLPLIWDRDLQAGQQRLQELHQLTTGALAEMRTLLLELRPAALAEADLGVLLKQLADGVAARARIRMLLSVEGGVTLPVEVKIALYRIAQEALNNVAKHSGAGQAVVELRTTRGAPGGAMLIIRDDGRGFRPKHIPTGRLGLGIMHERAEALGAHCVVESEPGRGTVVRVIWPGRQAHCSPGRPAPDP